MAQKLMGKKRGMTQLFTEQGHIVVCTILEMEPNVVTQVKTKATDGYDAVQLGFEKVRAKDKRRLQARVKAPQRAFFSKSGIAPRKKLQEFRVDEAEKTDDYSVGQEIGVEIFTPGTSVDVTGISKGKGYQGLMKKDNYAGGPAAHGSGFHRHAGSTGMRTTPGRCFPNGKRASRMGFDRKTIENLLVVDVRPEEHVLLVKGAVPGPVGALVTVRPAKKHRTSRKHHAPKGVKLWQH